jgi:hypothetical protein
LRRKLRIAAPAQPVDDEIHGIVDEDHDISNDYEPDHIQRKHIHKDDDVE